MVGVNDLAAAVIVADLAGGDDVLADLERLLEPLAVGVKVGERDEARVIAQADACGELGAGMFELVDRASDRGDLADLHRIDGRAVATVDPAGGEVEEDVEPRLAIDQAAKVRAHFRPDAGKAVDVLIEGIEDLIAHVG